jgi:hypothetical protein
MSSRCRLARLKSVLVVGVEVVENGAGEAAFEAAQGFCLGVTGGQTVAVVGLAESVETDLGDCYPVSGSVELAVARAGHAHAAGGVSRPHRNGCDTGVAGEGGLAFEPGHSGGFPDEFGRSQLAASGRG